MKLLASTVEPAPVVSVPSTFNLPKLRVAPALTANVLADDLVPAVSLSPYMAATH